MRFDEKINQFLKEASTDINTVTEFNKKMFDGVQNDFVDYIGYEFEGGIVINTEDATFGSDEIYVEWEVPKPMTIKVDDFMEYLGDDSDISAIEKLNKKEFLCMAEFEYLDERIAQITIDKVKISGGKIKISYKKVDLYKVEDFNDLYEFGGDLSERYN
jgi:hypothetical protein